MSPDAPGSDPATRYDPSLVDAAPYPQIIDGAESRAGTPRPAVDPSTGDVFASWLHASPVEVDAALGAARRSFDAGVWSRTAYARRAEVLDETSRLIRREGARLATLESLDTGKSIHGAAQYDLYEAANAFSYAAGLCRDLHGDVRRASYPPELFPGGGPRVLTMRLREPAGVVCELLPWNAPLMTGSQRLAAGLAAGCSIVAKAPEEAVVTLVNLVRLLHEAGLPPGVCNLVLGTGESVGEQLVADPRVDLVSLTGSAATGQRVMAQAACNLTPVHLELGGKAPVIVFADSDLDAAAHWATMANFVNSGQVCVAGSRLLVERVVYDDVVPVVAEAVGRLRVGDALDPATFVGPLVNSDHAQRVRGFVSRALAGGDAELVTGGAGCDGRPPAFVSPTVLGRVRPGSEAEQEEIFGPVLSVLAFDGEDEAIAIANDTRYGLNASVFSRDVERAFRVVDALRCGEVNVNCHFTPDMIGGRGQPRKMSGWSPAGLEAYTTLKGVHLQVSH